MSEFWGIGRRNAKGWNLSICIVLRQMSTGFRRFSKRAVTPSVHYGRLTLRQVGGPATQKRFLFADSSHVLMAVYRTSAPKDKDL